MVGIPCQGRDGAPASRTVLPHSATSCREGSVGPTTASSRTAIVILTRVASTITSNENEGRMKRSRTREARIRDEIIVDAHAGSEQAMGGTTRASVVMARSGSNGTTPRARSGTSARRREESRRVPQLEQSILRRQPQDSRHIVEHADERVLGRAGRAILDPRDDRLGGPGATGERALGQSRAEAGVTKEISGRVCRHT
jgi:hypothetical protein